MRKLKLVGILSAVLGVSSLSQAQSASTSNDEAVKLRARSKNYVGGPDEEPLKVQAQLPDLKSRNEAPDEPPAPEDAD